MTSIRIIGYMEDFIISPFRWASFSKVIPIRLKDLSSPKISVVRNNKVTEINSTELVPDDIMILCEGVKIPADGIVLSTMGLCVDESSLTGDQNTCKIEAAPAGEYTIYMNGARIHSIKVIQ